MPQHRKVDCFIRVAEEIRAQVGHRQRPDLELRHVPGLLAGGKNRMSLTPKVGLPAARKRGRRRAFSGRRTRAPVRRRCRHRGWSPIAHARAGPPHRSCRCNAETTKAVGMLALNFGAQMKYMKSAAVAHCNHKMAPMTESGIESNHNRFASKKPAVSLETCPALSASHDSPLNWFALLVKNHRRTLFFPGLFCCPSSKCRDAALQNRKDFCPAAMVSFFDIFARTVPSGTADGRDP